MLENKEKQYTSFNFVFDAFDSEEWLAWEDFILKQKQKEEIEKMKEEEMNYG